MLWTDPWVQIASAGKTLIPVPTPRLPSGVTFVMKTQVDEDWLSLIGTPVKTNIGPDCLIPCLYKAGILVATCIFRSHPHSKQRVYALETLVAKPRGQGYGGHLLHAAVHYMGSNTGFVYVWELSLAGLIVSWFKGWLASMVRLEYGWIHAGNGFSTKTPYIESGLDDGYIYMFEPDKEILAVPQKAWTAAKKCPGPGWSWSGEFVITGNLNTSGPIYRWFTQEVSVITRP